MLESLEDRAGVIRYKRPLPSLEGRFGRQCRATRWKRRPG